MKMYKAEDIGLGVTGGERPLLGLPCACQGRGAYGVLLGALPQLYSMKSLAALELRA